MAKILVLVSLLLYIIAIEVAPAPVDWSAVADISISDMQLKVDKALKDAVAAAPPAKRLEAEKAALRYMITISLLISKAKGAGDLKKANSIAVAYEGAANMVNAAPPSEKYAEMEKSFSIAAMPNPAKCPDVDKSFCETYSKSIEAQSQVFVAAKKEEKTEVIKATSRLASDQLVNIAKAYATGDDKEIARVLAAYNKATDAVIAAAPAEKLKVMEETFAAANKA